MRRFLEASQLGNFYANVADKRGRETTKDRRKLCYKSDSVWHLKSEFTLTFSHSVSTITINLYPERGREQGIKIKTATLISHFISYSLKFFIHTHTYLRNLEHTNTSLYTYIIPSRAIFTSCN